jgi:putative ABC transport system permease protein
MSTVALKGLLGRKLRAALTALAIVLGVAMVAGTFVLTDSINNAFTSIFTSVRAGSNAVITGKAAFDLGNNNNNTSQTPTFSQTLLPKVRALPAVAEAEGSVNGEAHLIGKNGKAIVFGGAPNLGFSIVSGSSPFNPLKLVSGTWPHEGQVVIDKSTASKKDFQVGDLIGVQANGPVERLRISGIVEFGSAAGIGGATLAGFSFPTAQALFQKKGQLDEIAIASKRGVSDAELLKQVTAILPPSTQVRTGAQQAAEDAQGVDQFISFLRTFLLAFGGISLFVGSFVIANSLSITIAQRTREFATLRTLGATRRQVLGSVVLEALVIGVLASVTGLFLGLALAKGLFKLFGAVGFTLPNSGLLLETRTIILSLAAGIVVTLLASLRPAMRATRVPPIAAVREGAVLPPSRFAPYRIWWAIGLTVVGLAALLNGLFHHGLGTSQVLFWLGVGALLVFFGVALMSVTFVRPLAAVLGWPAARIAGISGTLARENSQRNPQRTASTASALMIGLALVTLVAVLASGITSTFRSAVTEEWGNTDYAITAQNNFDPIPPAAADAAATVPGVTGVGNVRTGEAKAFGSVFFATALNPATRTMFNLDWIVGSPAVLATLGAHGAFVDKDYATKHHLSLGSPVSLLFANGDRATFNIRGVFNPPAGGSPLGRVTISQNAWDRHNPQPQNLYSFVAMVGGETPANMQRLERRLHTFPNAKVATKEQFINNQIAPLNNVLNILYVLLALSVVISLVGVINTLILTVFERTREIGMLRAIGMTRRQIRAMIRYEAVITAVIGGVLGIVVGIVLGALLVARVKFINFSLPTGSLIVFLIAAVVVGLLAAIFPARRAARLNVLEALQYE